MEHKTISLADQVFERLENDILSGKYARGEMLTELRLCNELGVSRTPIRESLRRLEQERLVEVTGKGNRVLGITRQDFEDMCDIRRRIEDMAVHGFIRNMTDATLQRLREAVELQEFYLEKHSSAEQLKTMDSQFHNVIYACCGSTILRDTLAPLHNKVQKYRRQSMESRERAEESVREHREIYEAIAAKNSPKAEWLMTRHIEHAMHTIMDRDFDSPT